MTTRPPAESALAAHFPARLIGALSAAAAVAILVPQAVRAQSAPDRPWDPVTDQRLLDPQDGDWMSYRRNYDVTGYSPLDQIDRENVDELQLVWSYSVRDNNRWVPTPVVANGLMYVAEGSGRVTAFEVETGDVAWIHDREYPDDIRFSQAAGKHRGVALYGDRVYWGTADSYLVALDARTGEQDWEVRTGDYTTGEGHTHPPLIVDGKVFIGHAGGDFGAKGAFRAFDTESGELLWTFDVIPRAGDPALETWSESEWEPRGGAPWNTISYDGELGLVYFGTGQPYPWAETLRGRGDALYTNSIVALDAETGERRWHFQLMPGDSWDRAAYESMLVDLPVGGEVRQALVTSSKIGWAVVLDRVTGEFIHAFRIGFDNLVTGWTEEGRPIYNQELIPTLEDVDSGRVFEVCPFYHGGRDLNSPAYSPDTGLYYVGFNNTCMSVSFSSASDPPSRIELGVSARPERVPGYDYVGEFVAYDPATGEQAWSYRSEDGSAMTAASLATAGGLVFAGTVGRELFALDDRTGERLWSTRLNGDVSGAPVTFTVDGKQYLAVGAGGRIAQSVTYGPLTDTVLPDGSGVIWVFALP